MKSLNFFGMILFSTFCLFCTGAHAGPEYRIYATREGLVGGTTANEHVITNNSRFAALPSGKSLACNGCYGKTVTIRYKGKSATVPIWDIGPWNTKDDYWNSPRELFQGLPKGKHEAQTAYQDNYNNGKDQFDRPVLNPAGIDLSNKVFWDDLGMSNNDWVDVEFNWVISPLNPKPDAVARDSSHIDVVAHGAGGDIIHKSFQNGGELSAWISRGGNVNSGSAILSKNPDHLEIFFRGDNDSLKNKWWTATNGWTSSWNQVGNAGMMNSGPDAVSRENGRMDIVARGNDNQLIHKYHLQGQGWSSWINRGGDFKGEPAVCSKHSNHMQIFVRCKDDDMRTKRWTQSGGWEPWSSIGNTGKLTSAPDAVGSSDSRMDVVARGDKGQIIHKIKIEGSGWTNWTDLGTKTFASAPTICSRAAPISRYSHAEMMVRYG